MDKDYHWSVYFFLQILMMGGTFWRLVAGSMVPSFPCIEHFTCYALFSDITKVGSLFLSTLALGPLCATYGIQSFWIGIVTIIIAIICTTQGRRADKIEGESLRLALKDKKIIENSRNKGRSMENIYE
jgi:hypothetical protein